MTSKGEELVVETESEAEALKAINAYMDAFNARDVAGLDRAMNFPHVRHASGKVRVMEEPGSHPDRMFELFAEAHGWDHSEWDYRRVVQSTDDKVHFVVQFTRYRKDGSKIGVFPSVWVVTRQEGHWGIQMRSSFAP
jgi:hypothetical protein